MNRPAEAAAWLRVMRLLDACGTVEHPHDALFAPDDHLRSDMLRAMASGSWIDPDDEEDGHEDPEPKNHADENHSDD